MPEWTPRRPWPTNLVRPLRLGVELTPGQARGPHFRRVGKGLYVPSGTTNCGEQRIVEVAHRMPEGSSITGWAALRLAGAGFFDGLKTDGRTPLPVPIAMRPYQRLAPDPTIRQIRGGLCAHETRTRHGLRCTIPERAILDAIRDCDDVRDAVCVIDMALVGRTTTRDRIGRYQAGHPRRWGICRHRDAFPLAIERSRSPMETAMRLIWIIDAGLPLPLSNWPVLGAAGQFLGTPDLLSPELGVFGEFDGADHRNREQHRIDVDRSEAFKAVGLEGFTLVGADIQDRELVVSRMTAAVRRARQRPRGTWQIPPEAPAL